MRQLLFVVGEGKGCVLTGAKYEWELYSELHKNFFASHAFVCISISNEMKDMGVLLL